MAETKIARNAAVVSMIKSKVPKAEIARLVGISRERVAQIYAAHQYKEKKAKEIETKRENRSKWKNIFRRGTAA